MNPRRLGFLVLALAAACTPAAPPAQPDPVPEPPPAEARPAAALRIGLLLPGDASAELAEYGRLVREGIELALEEHRAAGGRSVEVVLAEDAGLPARAATALRELEADRVVAVIGPLLSEALRSAGGARAGAVPVLSPTASDPAGIPSVYTLNATDPGGAAALGRYAASQRLAPVALLYANDTEFEAQATAFAAAVRAAGGAIAADVPYAPGTTTFGNALERVRTSGARAVFIPASERDVRQIAPQLEYYGLGSIRVLGNEAWVSDEVLRTVPARQLEGVVAWTPFHPEATAAGWPDFVARYEARYRRTLDTPYPALGYDAAKLVLRAIESGADDASELARALRDLPPYRGATGVLTVGDRITREPSLVLVRGGSVSTIQE